MKRKDGKTKGKEADDVPQSIDNWNIAQTLNCRGEFWRKKYTILPRANNEVGLNFHTRDGGPEGLLVGISSEPAEQGGQAESVQGFLLVIAGKRMRNHNGQHALEGKGEGRRGKGAHLMACGMGSVLSRPSARKPRVEMNICERPKMRKSIVCTRLSVGDECISDKT